MKTLKFIMLAVFSAIMALGMTSCGGYSDKQGEKLSDKYADGDLSKEDVAEAIDVYEEYAVYVEEELNKLLDKVGKNEKKFTTGLDDLKEKIENKWDGVSYIYDMFADNKTSYEKKEKELGKNNIKRMQKLIEKWNKKFGETILKKIENKFDSEVAAEYADFMSDCYLPVVSVSSNYDYSDY